MTTPNASTRQPITLQNPPGTESVVLGMGCFWGAEKRMSELPGVVNVESGYANGDIAGNYDAVLAHERAQLFCRDALRCDGFPWF